MAIIAGTPGERGLFFPDQYIRIEKIEVEKTKMRIEVGVHLNQESALDGNPPHTVEYVFSDFDMYSTKNLWEQGYEKIKQRWVNSIDA